jgi:hypothetical protein
MEALIASFSKLATSETSDIKLVWTSKDKGCCFIYKSKTLCRLSLVGGNHKKDAVEDHSIERSPRFIRHWRSDDTVLREITERLLSKSPIYVDVIMSSIMLLCTDLIDVVPMSELLKYPDSEEHGCSDGKKFRSDLDKGPHSYRYGSGYLLSLLEHLCDAVDWAVEHKYQLTLTSGVLLFPELTEAEKEAGLLLTTLPVIDGFAIRRSKQPNKTSVYEDIHGFLGTCSHGAVDIHHPGHTDLNWWSHVVAEEDLPLLKKLQSIEVPPKNRKQLIGDKDNRE